MILILDHKLSKAPERPIIGLALGSGASRGWSHIGVIKSLGEAGIDADIVCGTSVGAIIGGAYLAGNLEKLEEWVLGSSRSDVFRFFDIKFSQAGFINVERMQGFLHRYVASADQRIEDLARQFVAVSTDIETGREIWLKEGNLAEAIRASMAMPGLFPAVRENGRWLVDGGLVNPVPVTACRALGAEVVIGVNLNSDIVSQRNKRNNTSSLFSLRQKKQDAPGMLSAVSSSISIFQDRITRSRLAGDPADVLISPKLGDMGILEFERAAEAMQEGAERVQYALPEIQRVLGISG
ncbi:MAG: patatin-like phospholipase family protein [Gammaproteobacteria bacterium]|nr:patatin-like phospholipase family protein [Gammaproteobacteria bacterium]